MADTDILIEIASHEFDAEKRYAEQISRLCDGEVKQLLAQLKDEKRQHKNECIVKIKALKADFNDKEFSAIDMDLNTLLCATLPEIIGYLEINEKNEAEAKTFLADQLSNVEDAKIKEMIEIFSKNTIQHLESIAELLRKERMD